LIDREQSSTVVSKTTVTKTTEEGVVTETVTNVERINVNVSEDGATDLAAVQ